MNDATSPASGNRWEPTDQPAQSAQPTPAAPPVPPVPLAPVAPPVEPVAMYAEPAPRSTWTRARTAVAGGAAAVLLAGGLGGYALGHTTASGGEDESGRIGQQGGPAGFDRDGDDDGPGGGLGPGQPPGLQQNPQQGQQGSDEADTQDS